MSAHTITNALSFITFINREAGENLVTPGENFGEFLIDETGVSALTPTIESMGVSGLFHDECMAFLEFSKDCHLEFPCTVEQARRWALDVLGLEIQMDEQAEARGTHVHTKNAEARAKQCIEAAMTVLAEYPDECKGKRGNRIAAVAIAGAISNHAHRFWDAGSPPLGHDRLVKLVAGWLKKAGQQK